MIFIYVFIYYLKIMLNKVNPIDTNMFLDRYNMPNMIIDKKIQKICLFIIADIL